MIPHRVRIAVLIAFLTHGLFIITARYRLSYDAFTHMFFADHYARDWWAIWDTRWFGGFEVISYPPLVHQLVGLFGLFIGVDTAYAFISWGILTIYPLGVYVFSRIFCNKITSGYASLGAALLPSIYYSIHAFGQLPTITATLFSLFSMGALADYLRHGHRLNAVLAISLVTVSAAAHHATLLFLPLAVLAVSLHILLNEKINRNIIFTRLIFFGVFSVFGAFSVIWPFWTWGQSQTMQIPIDHSSRHNFFFDRFAFIAFFLPMYGPLIIFIPYAFILGRSRRFLGLFLSFCILFLLGLGGTTPLPRLLFGPFWEWLTYDRFALWASLLLLPFFGLALQKTRLIIPRLIKVNLEIESGHSSKLIIRQRGSVPLRLLATLSVFMVFFLVSLIAGFIPSLVHSQPDPIDMEPIVDFLATNHRSDWRYLTFGFGDQLAYLSRLTDSTTIDGSYFTARPLSELRKSGIGQIDGALWSSKGIPGIDPILKASGKYGIRWAFVNRDEYLPILIKNGWKYSGTLKNSIQVWENPNTTPPNISVPAPMNPLISFSWGTLPLLVFSGTLALAGLRLRPNKTELVLRAIIYIAIGLLPVSLTFWYFRQLTSFNHPLVYFTYDNALFFISDALVLIALLTWLIHRVTMPADRPRSGWERKQNNLQRLGTSINTWFIGLCLYATLSILWSQDWHVSLYVSLHLWLAFGLFLMLQKQPGLWKAFAWGSCAVLSLQFFFGLWQFISQSTSVMVPFGLEWPGLLEPAVRGASVVQLIDGTRLLRAYGSLPHPNILSALIVSLLVGPSTLFLMSPKKLTWHIPLIGASAVLLILTFSRAGWIGLLTAGTFLILYQRLFYSTRLKIIAITIILSLVAAIIPLRDYIFLRVTNAPVHTEQVSWTVRLWLINQSIEIIKEYPMLGTGIGAYTLTSAHRVLDQLPGITQGAMIEPVHNVQLLAVGELGVGGGFLIIWAGIALMSTIRRARDTKSVLFSSALIGLLSIELFDHLIWTLAPGRILFSLILGIWYGQILDAEKVETAKRLASGITY